MSLRMLHGTMGKHWNNSKYAFRFDVQETISNSCRYVCHSYDAMIFIVLTYEASSLSYQHPHALKWITASWWGMAFSKPSMMLPKTGAAESNWGGNWSKLKSVHRKQGLWHSIFTKQNTLYECEIYLNDFLEPWLPPSLLCLLDNLTGSQFTSTILPSYFNRWC